MDTQFTYNRKPVFIDNQGPYYFDNNKKVYLRFIGGGGTKIKRVEVPIPIPLALNGTFTLSQDGSISTIQSAEYLTSNPIPTNDSIGLPGNLRVRVKLGAVYPIGSLVQDFTSGGNVGTIKNSLGANIYELDVLSSGNWAIGDTVQIYNIGTATAILDSIQSNPIIWILTIPTIQAINTITFNSRDTTTGLITSTGTCDSSLVQNFNGNAANGFFSTNPNAGFSIGIADLTLTNGFKSEVTAINFSNQNSQFNYELTWTKLGQGISTTTDWIIT